MSSKYLALLEASFLPFFFKTAFAAVLNLSHNLRKNKKIPAGLGKFLALRELRLAGNFWEMGGLPDEMENLKELRVESPLLWA